MTLGEQIYELRKKAGLSQQQLAEKVNSSRQAVSKWENNLVYPETERLVELSNIFGVSIDFLVKGKEVNDEYKKSIATSMSEVSEFIENQKVKILSFIVPISIFILLLFHTVGYYYFKICYEINDIDHLFTNFYRSEGKVIKYFDKSYVGMMLFYEQSRNVFRILMWVMLIAFIISSVLAMKRYQSVKSTNTIKIYEMKQEDFTEWLQANSSFKKLLGILHSLGILFIIIVFMLILFFPVSKIYLILSNQQYLFLAILSVVMFCVGGSMLIYSRYLLMSFRKIVKRL